MANLEPLFAAQFGLFLVQLVQGVAQVHWIQLFLPDRVTQYIKKRKDETSIVFAVSTLGTTPGAEGTVQGLVEAERLDRDFVDPKVRARNVKTVNGAMRCNALHPHCAVLTEQNTRVQKNQLFSSAHLILLFIIS